ncbi:hypothetical protein [Bradyrhizobium sp. USDA 10063]
MTDLSDQYTEAKDAKTAAMDQAESHANAAWLDLMLELTRVVCLTHEYFTVDDVVDLYRHVEDAPVTHEPRALGPVMLRAAKAGYCKKTNTTEARSNHNRPLAVWRSLICEVSK